MEFVFYKYITLCTQIYSCGLYLHTVIVQIVSGVVRVTTHLYLVLALRLSGGILSSVQGQLCLYRYHDRDCRDLRYLCATVTVWLGVFIGIKSFWFVFTPGLSLSSYINTIYSSCTHFTILLNVVGPNVHILEPVLVCADEIHNNTVSNNTVNTTTLWCIPIRYSW